MLPHLPTLDAMGYKYYFLYTLMNNPRPMDPKCPSLTESLRTFRELSDHVGPHRVVWRYDPIVFTQQTDSLFHQRTYGHIAHALSGFTRRSVISMLSVYLKLQKRLRHMAEMGFDLLECNEKAFQELMESMVHDARNNGMEVFSCAEERDLGSYGVFPGKCIDDEYIYRVFGIRLNPRKDPSQRKQCGCVVSKEVGMYDSCLFQCRYCYATSSFERARENYTTHRPESPSLVGWHDVERTQRSWG
jgi:hypothetical protein